MQPLYHQKHEISDYLFQNSSIFLMASLFASSVMSMRIFIAESVFRFLYVSYEKSARKASCARLYHQADPALGFAKRLRVGHDYGIDLLVRHRGLIQAGIETAGIDFPGNLLGFHAVAGAGQEVDYGFFEFHKL